jgi:dynein heavy chain
MFIFCVIWSLGGALVDEDRDKFSDFVRNTSGLILPNSSLYENYFNIKDLSLNRWDDQVPTYEAPASKKFADILVPTVDTVRYAWLLNQIIGIRKPAMFCGDSGTAKTVTAISSFNQLD